MTGNMRVNRTRVHQGQNTGHYFQNVIRFLRKSGEYETKSGCREIKQNTGVLGGIFEIYAGKNTTICSSNTLMTFLGVKETFFPRIEFQLTWVVFQPNTDASSAPIGFCVWFNV